MSRWTWAATTRHRITRPVAPAGRTRLSVTPLEDRVVPAITAVAGTGTAGFSGDGSAAPGAMINSPIGVAVDDAGDLYFADTGNNRVRKVSAATGAISTIAGDGTAGFKGDGTAAAGAELNQPFGVAVDAAGNVYIADSGNNRVRKVTAATGVITTVAGTAAVGSAGDGGPAGMAALSDPTGVAVDAAGNVYIADRDNNRIRQVSAATGVITTIAGDGAPGAGGDGTAAVTAQLRHPSGVAVDDAGDVLVADFGNNEIRLVSAATGAITTIAGTGSAGFSGDGGAGAGAQLSSPVGVAVDAAGNVYVADTGNNRVRQVSAVTGIITTVAGVGTAGFSGNGGNAPAAQLSGPQGVAVAPSGHTLFVADTSNHEVRALPVDRAVRQISTVAGNGTAGFGGDSGHAVAAQLNQPAGVAVDAAGNVYVADALNNRVRKVSPDGVISTVAGTGTAGFGGDGGPATGAELNVPFGLAVDAAGNLFIADHDNHRVREVFAGSGIIVTVAGDGTAGFGGDGGDAFSARLDDPAGVAVDAAGNLFIADSGNERVREVSAKTGFITTIAGDGTPGFGGDGGDATTAQLQTPLGVAVDAAGSVYVADLGNFRVRKIAGGVISTVAGDGTFAVGEDGTAATGSHLSFAFGLAADAAGNLYITDVLSGRVREVSAATGIITTVAGTGAAGFSGDGGDAAAARLNQPVGLAIDAAGNLYFADSANNRVREVKALQPPAFTDDAPPAAVAGTPYSFTFAATGFPVPTFTAAGLPAGLALDPTTGVLSGTPTAAGTATVTVTAANGVDPDAAVTVSLVVGPAITVAPATLPGGTVGTPYAATVTATGGAGPYAFAVTVGALPPGLTLGSNGSLTGTPTAAGTYAFTITATGTLGTPADQPYTLVVDAPESPPPASSPPAGASPPASGATPPTGSAAVRLGATRFAVGSGAGGGRVTLYDPDGSTRLTNSPFGTDYAAGVRTAAADFNGDGVDDVVVGTGPGGPSHVKVLDGATGAVLFAVDPYEATFTGGVFVAVGDVNGDGVPDVVVTPDEGGGPVVAVYDGAALANGTVNQIARFLGIDDPNFRGGARAAVGDVTGDGVGDVVVAAGFGGGPRVAGYDGRSVATGTLTPAKLFDYLAFEDSLRNGVYVAAGDVDGDGKADVIAGGGPGGGPRVSVFAGADLLGDIPTRTADFFAGDPANRGGVRVAAKNLDGDAKADLVTGDGAGAGSRVTAYPGKTLAATPTPSLDFDADPGFTGGVFVG